MTDTDDPEFGPLRATGYTWTLDRRVRFGGRDLPVEVEAETDDAAGPTSVQREALRHAFALPADVLAQAAPAVVQNYEVYRDAIGDDELPPLAAPADVWRQVEPTGITVPQHGGTAVPTFLLMAECDWDPEHGLVVRFRRGEADAASQQGDLGVDD